MFPATIKLRHYLPLPVSEHFDVVVEDIGDAMSAIGT